MRDYSECYDLSENVISITTLNYYFSGSFELINNNYIRIIQIPGKKDYHRNHSEFSGP